MTDREYIALWRWWTGLHIAEHIPEVSGKQSNLIHDEWSAYRYGNTVKVVYVKNAPKRREKGAKVEAFAVPEADEGKRFSQSLSRSRARIFELASCNEFTHFCTFTQSPDLRERFDLREFRKDFAQYVRNLNRSRDPESKIKYVLIPEEHKKGGWHMHGLLMGLNEGELRPFSLKEKLPQRIREKLKEGEQIFDWEGYRKRFGFFTCTPIKDPQACSRYLTKYITKDLVKSSLSSGEHLFFASQGLKGRETLVKSSIDLCPIEKWSYENEYVKVAEFSIGEGGELVEITKESP